jgi:hypothetical protein
MSQRDPDGFVKGRDSSVQVRHRRRHLFANFAAFVHVIIQLDVRFTAAANQYIPKTRVSIEYFGREAAPRALNIKREAVNIDHVIPRRLPCGFSTGRFSSALAVK